MLEVETLREQVNQATSAPRSSLSSQIRDLQNLLADRENEVGFLTR